MRRLVALLAVLLAVGCQKRVSTRQGDLTEFSGKFLEQTKAPAGAPAPPDVAPLKPDEAEAKPIAVPEVRKLIRTGQLSVEVKDFRSASRRAAAIAQRFGGYVSGSSATKDEAGRYSGVLTIRVAADHFDEAFGELGALGKVESENVSTEDITKAYYDLEGRIRVAQEAESRIREILRNRAAKLSDILEAEKELTRVVGEIEQMEGERRFYDRQAALSTITASLHEPQAIARAGSLTPLAQAIHDSLGAVATSVAAIIYVVMYGLPWMIVAALLWVVIRRARRRRSDR